MFGRARILVFCLAVFVAAGLDPAPARAAELSIAAAADLKGALDEIVAAFRAPRKDDAVSVIYGSSGKLQTQIREGAPFDIFFSADVAYAQALRKDGFAATDPEPYAVGRLVIWSAKPDANKLRLEELADPKFGKIAIANPAHAPYGKRAEEALRAVGIWDKIQDRLVMGENIAQAAQFAQSGAADVAIIAQSLTLNKELAKGGHAMVPDKLHSPLVQAFVVTRAGAQNPLARAFVDFFKTKSAHEIMTRYGFALPRDAARQ